MYTLDDSTDFTFCGRHCAEVDVAFIPSQYPFVPAQTIPSLAVSGRHGTLRWPGRTFKPRTLKGTLHLLHTQGDTSPIPTGEMLRRASEIVSWLCGQDGRGQLILDALPDRYYIAEADTEALLKDTDWANGSAALSFTCQPFARSIREETAQLSLAANAAKSADLNCNGNMQTSLAFDVKNTSASVMNTATVETDSARFDFTGLALDAGETLSARYTEDDILLLTITGVDGAQRSAMAARTTDSDDDLMLSPGRNRITVKTQRACDVTVRTRGRWL